MEYVKKTDGYALLLVLFLVVFFVGLSAVFVAASFNNSKQEKTVDVRNQSVVAAEMGVKLNLNNLKNEIKIVNQEYKNFMNTNMSDLINRATAVTTAKDKNLDLPSGMSSTACNAFYSKVHINTWIECETTEIENAGLDMYTAEVNSIYDNLSLQDNIIDSKTKFQMSPLAVSPVFDQVTRKIELPLAIKGKQNSSETTLKARLVVTIPDHTSESNDVVIKTILSEKETVDRVLIPPNDNASFCPTNPSAMISGVCKYTGSNLESYLAGLPDPSKVSIKVDDLCHAVEDKTKCNLNSLDGSGGAVYIKPSNQTLNIDNLNNLQDISMYVDGDLIIKNSNSADNNTIVSRSYSFHVSMNITNSNLVVLGNEDKTGFIDWKSTGKSVTISTNSKMCINLNGINLALSSNLNDPSILTSNGKLIFYPSRTDIVKLPAAVDDKIIYMNDFVAFLNECNVNTSGLPEGHSMKQFIDSTTEIEEIVDYGN
jgi:hypothetical protein